MLRCTIEMLPRGNESQKYTMGVVEIINDGEGTLESGNYKVTLSKEPPIAKKRGLWRAATVVGFDRVKLGPYDLLYRALQAAVGQRNR